MTSIAVRYGVVFVTSLILAGCQSKGRTFTPEPESAVLATRMHPEIKTAFDRDYIELIVKSTSAAGMERGCRGFVRVKSEYRSSLALVLQTNDIEFGRGSSRREVSAKAAEHRVNSDCARLASRLNIGGYDNIFLERVR
jgi:hypothetical protein